VTVPTYELWALLLWKLQQQEYQALEVHFEWTIKHAKKVIEQGDQKGRPFTYWVIANFGAVFEKYRYISKKCCLLFSKVKFLLILTKMGWDSLFSWTHLVTLFSSYFLIRSWLENLTTFYHFYQLFNQFFQLFGTRVSKVKCVGSLRGN
jgi:hypothetical protein